MCSPLLNSLFIVIKHHRSSKIPQLSNNKFSSIFQSKKYKRTGFINVTYNPGYLSGK